jgi:lactose/L-arabinose transport system permease protein
VAKPTSLKLHTKQNIVGWAFVIPASILIFTFFFYPIGKAFLLSFQTGFGANAQYAGLVNYKRLLSDNTFKTSLVNVLTFLVLQVPVMLLLALALAYTLNDHKLKFRALFRTALFLPCATSLVSYSIVFRSLFALDGFMNALLLNLNVIQSPINWLANPWTAKLVIMLALTWRWTGYNMIFFLSALQNIDRSIFEAAIIDGANGFNRFFKITIPMLKPIILLTAIMSTNGTLQLFDETVNITNGGPTNATLSISQYIYRLSFQYSPRFPYAAAMSFVVFVLVGILSAMQMRVGDKR